jgi:ribose transport system substrate-binding protein
MSKPAHSVSVREEKIMDEEKKEGDSLLKKDLSRGTFLKAAAGAALASTLYGPGKVFADGPVFFSMQKKYKIAIVPKGLDNPVFALAKLGLEKRATELGNVSPYFTASSTTDTAGDINVLQGLISEKVDAIGVSCNDPKAYVNVIDHAVSNGIKVICWDSDAPTSKRSVFYGVNSKAIGAKMAKSMNRLTGGKGEIVIISGDAAALNLNLRIAGAKSALSPGIKVLNTFYTKDDIPSAITATEDAIRANPNLAGILMVGGWALFSNEGATPLLDQHKGKIKVVSFDPLQSVVPYLRDRIVQSVWTQDYWGWGYESTTILYGLLQGERWRPFIPQPSHEVTPKQWKIWQARWAATAKGVNAAAKVWGEPPFKAPGP